ncbi:hypothetical protein ACFPOE_18400 [Caenimonas terrae]|uniref:TolC family protein n=1 Tax=Caenimonas terrae TaxID=696074 RepID=A0ABW0NK35_9BURK
MRNKNNRLPASSLCCTALAVAALAAALPVRSQPPPSPSASQSQNQPVRLRLANSLCTSMTGAVLTSQQVPPMKPDAGPAGANTELAARMQGRRDEYFSRLDGLAPFDGLYVATTSDVAQDGQTRYSFGLEWELYNQGRDEARKRLDRARIEGKTQYLQQLRDVEQRQLQENLLAVDQMRNRLLALLYEREAAAIRPVLERRRAELAAGRATRADVAEIEFKAERAALRRAYYAGTSDVLVYPQAQELINRIESVVLRPNPELVDRAVARSPDYQLQGLLASRGDYLPTLKDNLSLRLYMERSKEFERGPQNIVGARVRVPLGSDGGVRDAEQAARTGYLEQQESIRAGLQQRLTMLADRLRLKQNDMRLLQAENKLLRTKADLACYRLDFPVRNIAGDPDREVEELTLLLHEKQREILSARLDVLEVLTEISAAVKPERPEELYSLGQ